jgi:hypothetical protein
MCFLIHIFTTSRSAFLSFHYNMFPLQVQDEKSYTSSIIAYSKDPFGRILAEELYEF